MLQVVYIYSSNPRVDSTAFEDWKTNEIFSFHDFKGGDIKNKDLANNIKRILNNTSGVSSGTERYKGLDKTYMQRGFDIYRELFGSAKDFTFIISGDFSENSVMPLINKYLSNLPNGKDEIRDIENIDNIYFKPQGPVLVQFKSSGTLDKKNYKYKPLFIIPTKENEDWKERVTAEALGWVLSRKILELRFAKNYSLYRVCLLYTSPSPRDS